MPCRTRHSSRGYTDLLSASLQFKTVYQNREQILFPRSSFFGGSTPFFGGGELRAYDRFQFLCYMGRHNPCSMVDVVCAVFSCVQTIIWLPLLESVTFAHTIAHSRAFANTIRESALKVDAGRKIACRTIAKPASASVPDPTGK